MVESALIQAAQLGDHEAFNQLILKYQDDVYRQALWLVGDPAEAEDIAQNAFILAFRKLDTFRGERNDRPARSSGFRAWLLRIVTNVAYDELRRWKRRPLVSLEISDAQGDPLESPEWLEDPGASIETLVEQAELGITLRRVLEALPNDQRAVVVLVDVMNLDYQEAASALGVPLGTVKSRLARARQHLQRRLVRMPELGQLQKGGPPARLAYC